MSLSDTPKRGLWVRRATIRVLSVWDRVSLRFITLQPGAVLDSCRVLSSLPLDPHQRPVAYRADFEVEGRTYRCALYGFLPRTQVVIDSAETGNPAGDAAR